MKRQLSAFRLCMIVFCSLFIVLSTVFVDSAYAAKRKSKKKEATPQVEPFKEIAWPEPQAIRPATFGRAPSDAVQLINKRGLVGMVGGERWEVKDGYVTAASAVHSKKAFGDCQLHLEWQIPRGTKGEGQGRGNNGLKFMGLYEVQILDSFHQRTYPDGQASAIYRQHPPLVNASLKQGEWQTYDIIFRAPRFNQQGEVKTPARITVLHNGVLVHYNFEIQGKTGGYPPWQYTAHESKLPVYLAYHGNPVNFRNMWVRELILVE